MLKKNVLIWFLFISLMGISATIMSVKANPVDSIGLVYTSGTEELDVTITHNNGGSGSHIINLVAIKVNGTEVKTTLYGSQPSVTFTYNYANITASVGATIQVIVRCSISGNFSNSVVVQEGNGTSTTDEPSIPGYSGLTFVLLISIITLFSLNYKKMKKWRV
ncbi:MAG: hypothetical protein ACW98D_12815 [Promethearchaeota archaeon]|jgi:hypothetical protein